MQCAQTGKASTGAQGAAKDMEASAGNDMHIVPQLQLHSGSRDKAAELHTPRGSSPG